MLNYFERLIALLLIILCIPVYIVVYSLIALSSPGAPIFKQKRVGKNKTVFTMYKFRTMVNDADRLRSVYKKLNELDGPLFKITNDPRLTKVGRILVKLGFDEIPQFFNIVKGDMSFVGPRPFPLNEAKVIPKKYDARYSVLPGLTGSWVINGYHKLTFKKWMETDLEYVKSKTIMYDARIFLNTIFLLIQQFLHT